jgi:hypothetical protein
MRPKLFGLLIATALVVFTTGAVLADAIVRSFDAKGSIQPGWVVALSKTSDTTVELAPASDPERIYGVVIDPSSAPLTVQKEAQQVFAANSGDFPALVSTQNGNIHRSDYLTLSKTDGIAAKADSNDRFIIGRALEDFSGGSATIVYANDGSALGRIMIQLAPGKNPLLKEEASVPQPLLKAGEAIAGKRLSALRIYASVAVFIIAAVIAAVLLWGGISSAMVAIGRNPLSRHSIMRGLLQVVLASASALIIGLIGVYLLLKL